MDATTNHQSILMLHRLKNNYFLKNPSFKSIYDLCHNAFTKSRGFAER